MDDKLPEINNPGQRIEITEDQLGSAAGQAAPSRPPAPPAAGQATPGRPPAPPAPPAPTQASAGPALPAVAGAKAATQQPPPTQVPPVGGSYCSGCGSPVHPQAVMCPRCGVATVSAAQATGAAMNLALNSKSTGLAIFLSLIFTGAGHWYVGRVGRGFAFFGAAVISGILTLALIGFILLPIVWVWAAIDANKCAQSYNQLLLAQSGAQLPPPMLTG
jgi:TM2 domain-containing membrane protein YozV